MSNPTASFTNEQHATIKPYLRSVNTREVKTIIAVRVDKLKPFEYTSPAQRYATFKQMHAKMLARGQKKYPNDDSKARRQVATHMRSCYSAWGTTPRGVTVLMILRSMGALPADPVNPEHYTIASKKELVFFFEHTPAHYLGLFGTPEFLANPKNNAEVPIVDLRFCADAYLALVPDRAPVAKKKKKTSSSPDASPVARPRAPSPPPPKKKKKTKKAPAAASDEQISLSSLDGTQLALLAAPTTKPLDVPFLAQPDDNWEWPIANGQSTDRMAVALNKNFMAQYSRDAAAPTAALLNGARLNGFDIERYVRKLLDNPDVQQLAYDARKGTGEIDANPLLQSDAVLTELSKLAFAFTSDMILAHSLDSAMDSAIERKSLDDA